MNKKSALLACVIGLAIILCGCRDKNDSSEMDEKKDVPSVLEDAKNFVTENNSKYTQDMKKLQKYIQELTKQSTIDMDELWRCYKALLNYKTQEYEFKVAVSRCYDLSFVTEKKTERTWNEREDILREMSKYFDESVVNDVSRELTEQANLFWEFRDCVVMKGDDVDVDTTWENYYEKEYSKPMNDEEIQEVEAEDDINAIEWEVWTGYIGELEFSVNYPKLWEEFGATVQNAPDISLEDEGVSISMSLRLNDFSGGEYPADVIILYYSARDTYKEDGEVSEDGESWYEEQFGEVQPVLHYVKDGTEYRLGAIFDMSHHDDIKDWRRASWDDDVQRYYDYIRATITASPTDGVG